MELSMYVKVDPNHIEQLNRGIARLLRPTHLRDEHYVTNDYAPIHTHPETGEMVLALPDTDTIPIHMEADGTELAEVLEVFVTDGAITKEERDTIVAGVTAYAGQQVSPANFIPPSWASHVYTRDQLQADGWFPEPVE